jgi:hypothetical protein
MLRREIKVSSKDPLDGPNREDRWPRRNESSARMLDPPAAADAAGVAG